MLFHVSQKNKIGLTHEDQKKMLQMWEKFEPPPGFQIKMHVFAPDGQAFAVVEADTIEAVYEVGALWSGVFLDYEIVPVIDVSAAIPLIEKAIAAREA